MCEIVKNCAAQTYVKVNLLLGSKTKWRIRVELRSLSSVIE